MLGEHTSTAEVTNISSHGIWLFTKGKELFISYEDFPWFKEVPIGKAVNVKEISPNHFFWPDLDIDLSLKMIEHPHKYPLRAKL